ncbi:MAG TPA: class I SAM-dependent methyltransferase [Roseiflexaceae bacterium]|nr:class I SAM-dependent methyltransferase [Roseiflexaceae bacterium]
MTENAQLYDASVPDWPGELPFYQRLAQEAAQQGGGVLELACGTGRVGARLAQTGVRVVGFDRSTEYLEAARAKTAGLPHARWEKADLRTFDLGERFALIISPGHSFQFLLTPDDQLACLDAVRRHLAPGGRAVLHVDHQNIAWLGELRGAKGGQFEPTAELTHPQNGRVMRVCEAWSYEPATQTATLRTRREIYEPDGRFVERTERGPTDFHCLFPFEMQHLLARAGFAVEAVYGDFAQGPLRADSREMIWVMRLPAHT